MLVSVSNSPDRRFTPYVKRAVNFYGKILIPSEKLRNSVEIQIKFVKNLDVLGSAGIAGFNSRNKAREFSIELHANITAKKIFETLAHEMVHIKQYVYDELNDDMSKWQGKRINSEKIDYWFQPWEIEAHGLESGLLNKFTIHEKLWEVFKGIENPDSPIKCQPLGWR